MQRNEKKKILRLIGNEIWKKKKKEKKLILACERRWVSPQEFDP